MRITALVLAILGILFTIVGAFSMFGAVPAMIEAMGPLDPEASTAAFWGFLAALVFLASIAFGEIAKESH